MTERKPNITVQYTRLTHADKLPDRFLTSQVYTPADPESQREGMIFSQIEILNPWFPTSQIGQTIINTIIREYYRATDTSELNNFETALKKVNETLSQVTQGGETDWIGNLHGILILINGTDIHISQTGQTQAYLFRGGKVNHITEGLTDDSNPHPLRTFSNITSGTLQAGDRIIIANPLFLKTINLDTIKDIISVNPPSIAAHEFANILKRNRALAGEALIIEMSTKEDAAALPLEYKTDTIYLDQGGVGSIWHGMRGSLSKVNLSSASPSFSKFTTSIGQTLKKADDKFDTHIRPHIRNAAAKTYEITKRGTNKVFNKIYKGDASNSKLGRFFIGVKTKLEPTFKSISSKFNFGDDSSPRGKARKYGIWGAALIIVLIILILASRVPKRNTISTTDSEMQNIVTDLGNKFNKVKLLSAYNDKQVALGELSGIFVKLNEIESKQELPPSLTELKKQAIDELGGLTGAARITDTQEITNWGDRNYIAGFGDNAYAINNFLATKVPGNEDVGLNDINISAIAKDTEGKAIYLLSDKGMKLINTSTNKLEDLKLAAGKWPTSPSFKYFNKNIYMLDPTGATIMKYVPQSDGFGEGSDYSKPEGDELKNGIDLVVNGRVLVLMNNGNIVQFTSSGREAINFSDLPSDGFIKNPKNIFANLDSNDVVILHEDKWVSGLWRLSKFTRSGKYIAGYLLPDSLKKWKSIDFDVKDKVLWAVTDSKIYRAKLGE